MDTIKSNEQERLDELKSYGILDSPSEGDYDQFADFAARLCKTPVAIITMVDEHRQWFKAVKGLDFRETAREYSFCAHLLQDQRTMEIHDTLSDARFLTNPLVADAPRLRFYTGVPIVSPRGYVLGSIAVLDFMPRALDASQIAGLEILAEQVMAKLEIRRQQIELDIVSQQRAIANDERDALIQTLDRTNELLLHSYQNISDGFFLLDLDYRFTFVNHVAATMTRHSVGELVGKVFWDAYPFLLGTPFESFYRQAIDEKVAVEFEHIYEPWGRWLEIRVFPSADGLAVYFRDITKRHRSEEQLRLIENCVGRLFDIVMISEYDPLGMEDARVTYVNDAFQRRTGFEKDDILGKTQRSVLLPATIDAQTGSASSLSGRRERLHTTKSGRPFWIEQEVVQITDDNGVATHFISVARDITDRKKNELDAEQTTLALKLLKRSNQALLRSESESELLQLICAIAVNDARYAVAWVGMAQHDADKTIRIVAHASLLDTETYFAGIEISWDEQIAEGCGPAGQTIRSGVPLICEDFEQDQSFAPWRARARVGGFRSGVFLPLKNKDYTFGLLGLYRSENRPHTAEEITLLQDLASDLSFGIINLRERAERQKIREDVHRLAFFDTLTELPNRQFIIEKLATLLASREAAKAGGAVLHIGLDNFKDLNDTAGHEIGDFLLQQAARRIVANVPPTSTVARIGGDEFLVVLYDPGPSAETLFSTAQRSADALIKALSQPYDLAGNSYLGSASIGSAQFDAQPGTVIDLLKRADLALSKAKAGGRSTVCFFDPVMQERISLRASLIADLRPALERKQIFVHYQPQVDATGVVTGVETLLRWHHPQRGNVSPASFIPLSEEIGTITQLGQWVLRTSCEQLVAWADDPLTNRLSIAVNVSAHQFKHQDFVAQIRATLAQTGADPTLLKLELTESLLADNIDAVIAKMLELRQAGIGFSLDDFGTGYSSLSYLRRMPLDQLKIDQSFVRDALTDPNDAAIARTIVALGKSLGLNVIAEGVETEQQRQFLLDHGCLAYQGYLFSKPLAIDALMVYLQQAVQGRSG